MTFLSELGLTPTQHNEIEQADPELVQQWLNALNTSSGINNRTAWFLAGIRSGRNPDQPHDATKAKAIEHAERYIRNAGLYLPTPAELLDELFGPHGDLKAWATDQELQQRMLTLWRDQLPRAETWRRTHHPTDLETAEHWIRDTGWMLDNPSQELHHQHPKLTPSEHTRLVELANERAAREFATT